jgi:hypothetical protein
MTSNKQRHGTSGTARRCAREMSRGLVFHLAEEVDSLRKDLEHTSGGRAAKTLAKTEGLRVTLGTLAKPGAERWHHRQPVRPNHRRGWSSRLRTVPNGVNGRKRHILVDTGGLVL